MSAKIRFAICGMGHIGKRHAKIIEEHPDTNLAAFIDPVGAKSAELKELGYEVPFYDSLDSFF